jgi:hypothetical protein
LLLDSDGESEVQLLDLPSQHAHVRNG